jgi:hypothetical protein
MISSLGANGFLPPGIHPATWSQFEARYGFNPRRRTLLRGLRLALDVLRAAGCPRVFVGGSFVTDKPDPNDFDCCFEFAHHLDWARLQAAEILATADGCAAQRVRYGGEFYLDNLNISRFGPVAGRITFLEFFQQVGGRPVGIVVIDL